MAVTAIFQFRRDTASNWTANNPILQSGELGLETDTNNLKMGDGITQWIGLSYLASGPTGPRGPAGTIGNVGNSYVNFGEPYGSRNCNVVVTGQPGILSTSIINAWIMADTTPDHSSDEHVMARLHADCGALVPGTGFTIFATSDFSVTGNFNVRWTWM